MVSFPSLGTIPNKNWSEEQETYEDSLGFANWIKENQWVLSLPAKADRVYRVFKANDWRYESCGGVFNE